ncbi:MAG: hypothetical protein AABZ12_11230 [Planctomycetota bacterium]
MRLHHRASYVVQPTCVLFAACLGLPLVPTSAQSRSTGTISAGTSQPANPTLNDLGEIPFASVRTVRLGLRTDHLTDELDAGTAGDPPVGSTVASIAATPLNYSTGFETAQGFAPGFIGGQGPGPYPEPWSTYGFSAIEGRIATANPFAGSQNLRLAYDPAVGTYEVSADVPAWNAALPGVATRVTVSLDLAISAAGGSDVFVDLLSRSENAYTASLGLFSGGRLGGLTRNASGNLAYRGVENESWDTTGAYRHVTIEVDSCGRYFCSGGTKNTQMCSSNLHCPGGACAGRVRYYYDDRLFLEMPLPDGLLVEQFSVNTSNTNGTSVADVDNVVISTLGTCPADCNSNGAPDDTDIAEGISQDCNGNATPDDCEFVDCNGNCMPDAQDISGGASLDCNANGTPDECEPLADCNSNTIQDICDLASGASEDCNGNGVPDECDACDAALGLTGGIVFLSGDDADEHCPGSACGGLYPAILSYAIANSSSPGSGILALGVNEGLARDTFLSWNEIANGGPGASVTFLTAALDIRTVDFADYDVVYAPSTLINTPGGLSFAQLEALNRRRHDLTTFVNGTGGALVALTESDATNAYGWLPFPITTVTRAHNTVCPTAALTAALAPGATCANMSHVQYHTVFTGPTGFFGLDVLATATDTPVGDVMLIGGDSVLLCTTDCDGNAVPDSCEPDCQPNQVADACDIASGLSDDCDTNSVPDECQPDCDRDGAPDVCELPPIGTGTDCNNNGLPDECETLAPSTFDNGLVGSSVNFCSFSFTNATTSIQYQMADDFVLPVGSGFLTSVQWAGALIDATTGAFLPIVGQNFSFDVLFLHDDGSGTRPTGAPIDPIPGTAVALRSVVAKATNIGAGSTIAGFSAEFNPVVLTPGVRYWLVIAARGNFTHTESRRGTGWAWCGRSGTGNGVQGGHTFSSLWIRQGRQQSFTLQILGSDCNANSILDACDIAGGNIPDVNGNAVPDECEIFTPSPPLPEPGGFDKNRYVSFGVDPAGGGQVTALRVKLTSLHHPSSPPPNTPDFIAFEGQYRYVNVLRDGNNDPVFACPDSIVVGTTFKCAVLGCTPEYRDWAGELAGAVLHATGTEIVPSSVYHAAQLASGCTGNETTCGAASTELQLRTARWGDIDGNGQLNVLDVATDVDKVKDLATGTLIKPRTQLQPAAPDPLRNVNVLDIANAVDALKFRPYPFAPLTPCP